jgi:hypothetical protein
MDIVYFKNGRKQTSSNSITLPIGRAFTYRKTQNKVIYNYDETCHRS